jgi:hypothetical protein
VIDATNPLDFPSGFPPKLSNQAHGRRRAGRLRWSDVVDIGDIEGARELEAICIAWVKIGGSRGAWDHGFKLLVG